MTVFVALCYTANFTLLTLRGTGYGWLVILQICLLGAPQDTSTTRLLCLLRNCCAQLGANACKMPAGLRESLKEVATFH